MSETTSPFRRGYLDWEALHGQLVAWAEAHPEFLRLDTICRTPEGRELLVAVVDAEPERTRPAVWVDGNMHASELCGSNVAMAILEDLVRLHTDPAASLHGLPSHVCDRVRETPFYVMPRVSPDGAEAVLKTGRYVRSVPRDARPERSGPRWTSQDVDGDGQVLLMRIEDPTGELAESPEVPGLLVPRGIEDAGPFYKAFPEGVIVNWDGATVPDPSNTSDNEPDLNRNFPFNWAPEPKQGNAGRFPASEPESRAIVEYTTARPQLFAWLNLHTFGGCFIRPPGDRRDTALDPSELALWKQLGEWAEQLTGYPMVNGFEEFTYQPDTPLHGDVEQYAYGQRGCVAFACELWDLFARLELPRPKRFVDYYKSLKRADIERLARWDAEHNAGRVMRPWRKVLHPQLGEVEIGGLDPRFGLWNPPPEELPGICDALSALMFRVAALAPRLTLRARDGGGGRVEVEVRNEGYLPTYVLPDAKRLPWNESPHAVLETSEGCELVDPREGRRELGHLEGWGRGLESGVGVPYYSRSRGSVSERRFAVAVRGRGKVRVRVGSCRTGWVEQIVEMTDEGGEA